MGYKFGISIGVTFKFGEDSKRLCSSVETFVDFLFNNSLPWAAYCTGCLVALYKHPGVSTVVVGETWRHLFSNCVLGVTIPKSTSAGQYNHSCAGLKARIDGAVHGVQYIWDKKLTTEDWVFIPVDAKQYFNGINQIGTLWKFLHLWPSR